MTEIESLVAGFKSDVALAVGQHRRIVGAGNVGNFCKSIDFHRQRYGAKLEGLRHQGFDGAEIDAAAAQIAVLANDAIDKAQRSGVVEFHRRLTMADTEFGPDRDDTGGVQLLVAAVVVALDVVHVDGLGDAGDLIEVAEEIGVVDDAPPVALERRMAFSLRSN